MKKSLILPLILLISCANSGKITDFDNYYYEDIEGIDFVILNYEPDTWYFKLLFKNGIPTDLTEIDLENINKILQVAINNYNIDLKKSWEKDIGLSKYNRQYIAIINENGEKEVYVNCFKNRQVRNDEHWKNHLIIVVDGGSDYFQIKINLTKLFYYDFFVNGYA
jgi:hypothetical protein